MLKGTVGTPNEVTMQGFLLAVEMEEGTNVEAVMNKLADALTWIEGVGAIDIDHLGMVDTYDGPEIEGAGDIQDPKDPNALPEFNTGKSTES